MPGEESTAIAYRIMDEMFTRGWLEAANEIYATDHVSHDAANPGVDGPEAMKHLVAGYREAFPDLEITVEDVISSGEKVVIRWVARGTHKGTLVNIAPTSRQIVVTGMHILRMQKGKVQEEWVNWDTLGMMQQLGVVGE
jgi:steroid delta-isomerase-like uncharacterized protein